MDGSDVVLWSKLWTIGPLFGIEYPLLFLSSNELLMESKGQLVLYNCKTQQIKELQIRSEAIWVDDNTKRFEGTNLFVKSLISVESEAISVFVFYDSSLFHIVFFTYLSR